MNRRNLRNGPRAMGRIRPIRPIPGHRTADGSAPNLRKKPGIFVPGNRRFASLTKTRACRRSGEIKELESIGPGGIKCGVTGGISELEGILDGRHLETRIRHPRVAEVFGEIHRRGVAFEVRKNDKSRRDSGRGNPPLQRLQSGSHLAFWQAIRRQRTCPALPPLRPPAQNTLEGIRSHGAAEWILVTRTGVTAALLNRRSSLATANAIS